MKAANRYPGLSSFQPDQKQIFFGRDREARELYHLISVEKTVVLFAKSGIGKTSLLNAGVIPDLEAGGIAPVPVRFGTDAYRPEQHCSIALDEAWQRFNGEAQPRGRDTSAQESLWEQLKRTVFERAGRRYVPLLIFDQFEELFTLYIRPEQRSRLVGELADLIQERLPAFLREQLLERMDRGALTPAELAAAERPPELKFVFSIRSDMLHFMDELSEQIPYILRSRYQLFGLSEAQASDAIVKPAALDGPEFATAPFAYSAAALQEILGKLSKNREVESFQLQSVCQALEEKIVKLGLPPAARVEPDFYGGPAGLDAILEESYKRRLAELDQQDYLPARRLLEDALINENERRRSVDVSDLLARAGVTQALLDRLESMRLLRREPRLDSYYYEISHDTLLGPILKFRKEWLEEEAEKAREARRLEEEEKIRAEEDRQRAVESERLKNEAIRAKKRATFFAIGSGVLSILTGLAFVFAIGQRDNAIANAKKAESARIKADTSAALASREQKRAEIEKAKADSSARIALEKTRIAEAALKKADESLQLAKKAEARALALFKQVQIEKDSTEEQRKRAEKNYNIAQQKTEEALEKANEARDALEEQNAALAEVVRLNIKEADMLIYRLDYEGAYEKIRSVIPLEAAPEKISDALLELAFWYAETKRMDRAWGVLDTAYALAGRKLENKTGDRDAARAAIRALNPACDAYLETRYFPVMVDIQGGTDTIGGIFNWSGDSIRPFIITVSPYQMAETETTWWQYNLFCAASGYEFSQKPGWGTDGDNPVVYVGWYDAVAYANWLSDRKGLDRAITGDSDENYDVDLKSSGYRLPTEAEWEYAGRAGTNKKYAGCNSDDELGYYAWYGGNSGNRTRPVKGRKPNAWGLYGMSGNVWEWCWDWYAPDYPLDPKTDYKGPGRGYGRVLRGGSWSDDLDYVCRVADRVNNYPNNRINLNGFRLARHPK